MDLRALEHFLVAVEHGNLTAAAAELDVSQPALSKSLKRLERELGVRLVERGRFGIVPTPFGETLVAHGKAVRAELRQAKGSIQALAGAQRGSVVIGCGPTEATRLLPLAITRLVKANPELRFTVLYGLNEALMPMVRQGEVDFALSSVPGFSSDPDLVHESLFIETACVVARAKHPLARRKPVSPAELLDFPWILARRHELERRALDGLFHEANLQPPEAAIESTSTVLMKSVVLQSDFLTFLPRELIYWEEQTGDLVALRVEGSSWTRAVGITRRSRGTLSPASRALIDALKRVGSEFFSAAVL